MSWLVYVVRAAAAGLVVFVGAAVLLAGALTTEARAMMLGIGAVIAVGGFFAWPRRPNAWRRDPPTERQLEYATDLGIAIPRGATRGEVSDLISEATGEPFRPR